MVGLLSGEVEPSSGLIEVSGLASILNMFLCFNFPHEFPSSSGTMVLPDPEITEWDLYFTLPVWGCGWGDCACLILDWYFWFDLRTDEECPSCTGRLDVDFLI